MSDPVTALVPLSDLYIHLLNTRSEPIPEDIEVLADSIAEIGLMQNLMGYADPDIHHDIVTNPIGIVAGGRRLRAIKLLAERQRQALSSVMVQVNITDDEATARLWASAENTARVGLHPADEVRAYGRMKTAGADIGSIARAFAVTDRHVRGRLALSDLPGPALDALRANRISLDQAAALTTAQTEAALLAELQRVTTERWNTSATDIRRILAPAAITLDDRRIKYIGLERYRAAGGTVIEDLFIDRATITDEALLQKMFSDRLEKVREFTLARGWKWVEVLADRQHGADYTTVEKLERINKQRIDLPEADAEELAELLARGDEEELSEAEIARMEELEEREAGDYAPEDVETSGIFLYVNTHGELKTDGPYRRKADRPKPEGQGDDDGITTTSIAPESAALSQSLTDDLRRIRLAALQVRMGAKSDLMLDLLAYQLGGGLKPWSQALSASVNMASIQPDKGDGTTLPDGLTEPDRIQKDGEGVADMAGFLAFRALGKAHRNDILARCLARGFGVNGDLASFFAVALKPNPREFWTPTAAGYFARLPVRVMDVIWAELVPEGRLAAWAEMKKAEKVRDLDCLFNSADFREALGLSRDQNARIDAWLPPELQWPTPEVEADDHQQDDAA